MELGRYWRVNDQDLEINGGWLVDWASQVVVESGGKGQVEEEAQAWGAGLVVQIPQVEVSVQRSRKKKKKKLVPLDAPDLEFLVTTASLRGSSIPDPSFFSHSV